MGLIVFSETVIQTWIKWRFLLEFFDIMEKLFQLQFTSKSIVEQIVMIWLAVATVDNKSIDKISNSINSIPPVSSDWLICDLECFKSILLLWKIRLWSQLQKKLLQCMFSSILELMFITIIIHFYTTKARS